MQKHYRTNKSVYDQIKTLNVSHLAQGSHVFYSALIS